MTGLSLLYVDLLCSLTFSNDTSQSRTAARKELFGQTDASDECEKLYEESLWCLYALQDDLLQSGNPFAEEDRNTIATCKISPPLTLLA